MPSGTKKTRKIEAGGASAWRRPANVRPGTFTLTRVSGTMGIRILIVEDEAELADFIGRGLREEGFAVEHAADGQQASVAMQGGDWDLIVLDWWLPGEDGLAVLRRFRATGGAA